MTGNKQQLQKRASSRRQYEKRKAAGQCAYSGCGRKPDTSRVHCPPHLHEMSRKNRARVQVRKAQGLCVYCGERPQFWGVRCIICRNLFVKQKDKLPSGLRRALRLYREAEQKRECEQLQLQARFAIRKLLATGTVTGDYALALHLYAGVDNGAWRSYSQVARVMHISKERVRQLLYPSKIILTEILEEQTPWAPLSVKAHLTPQERSWRAPRRFRSALARPIPSAVQATVLATPPARRPRLLSPILLGARVDRI